MVFCIVVDQTDAELVEAVVKLFVDGVQVHDGGIGQAKRELEEQVRMAQDGFVDVEALRDRFGGSSGNERRQSDGIWGRWWDIVTYIIRTPMGSGEITTPVLVSAHDARYVVIFISGRRRFVNIWC